ncbi:hypothetical protein T12_7296 [Trichinella patagoniensis]|uniref:Uncharacterized protein n=1 Tax=Trichinella patagoniensis TaxID=990121 RepID=A0A0V0ZJ06_9BILA|nr:hypothetical protein T12_7296 [Trichinella patagoniensis]
MVANSDFNSIVSTRLPISSARSQRIKFANSSTSPRNCFKKMLTLMLRFRSSRLISTASLRRRSVLVGIVRLYLVFMESSKIFDVHGSTKSEPAPDPMDKCVFNEERVYSPSILQRHAARHLIGLKFHWFSCRLNFISCCCDEFYSLSQT